MRFSSVVISIVCLLVAKIVFANEVFANEIERPNVLLIMTDDQGYGDLGFNGNEMIETPNLDAFAKQSISFRNFHVCATCAETRAALMTGRYPMRSGVWHTIMGRSLLSPKATTLPQLLQTAGYRTGIFGKWHLGDNTPLRPFERGFDVSLTHGGGGVSQLPDVWGNDYFDDIYFRNGILEQQSGYCTDVFFEAAKQFMETDVSSSTADGSTSNTPNQPWFCYLATNAPHGPYNVPDELRQHYLAKGVTGNMAAFYGMISNIDENFGQLYQTLGESGQLENTIIIFMTDNGTAAGVNRKAVESGKGWAGFNANMKGTKGSQFDGGHRVPFIVSVPNKFGGSAEPKSVDRITAHIDVLPTIVELCGVEIPSDIDGRSLVPLLNIDRPGSSVASDDPADWPDRTLFVQVQRIDRPKKWKKCAVMTEQYRLIDGEQLFDMASDPGQRHDIAPDYPTVASDLRQKYEAWWSDVSKDVLHEHVYIELGSRAEPRSRLTAHDWHSKSVWSQTLAKKNPKSKGDWRVEFTRTARYKFEGRLRPVGVDEPLSASTVRLDVKFEDGTTYTEQLPVSPGSSAIEVEKEIPAGRGTLRLTLLDESSAPVRGCYFVYVTVVNSD